MTFSEKNWFHIKTVSTTIGLWHVCAQSLEVGKSLTDFKLRVPIIPCVTGNVGTIFNCAGGLTFERDKTFLGTQTTYSES